MHRSNFETRSNSSAGGSSGAIGNVTSTSAVVGSSTTHMKQSVTTSPQSTLSISPTLPMEHTLAVDNIAGATPGATPTSSSSVYGQYADGNLLNMFTCLKAYSIPSVLSAAQASAILQSQDKVGGLSSTSTATATVMSSNTAGTPTPLSASTGGISGASLLSQQAFVTSSLAYCVSSVHAPISAASTYFLWEVFGDRIYLDADEMGGSSFSPTSESNDDVGDIFTSRSSINKGGMTKARSGAFSESFTKTASGETLAMTATATSMDEISGIGSPSSKTGRSYGGGKANKNWNISPSVFLFRDGYGRNCPVSQSIPGPTELLYGVIALGTFSRPPMPQKVISALRALDEYMQMYTMAVRTIGGPKSHVVSTLTSSPSTSATAATTANDPRMLQKFISEQLKELIGLRMYETTVYVIRCVMHCNFIDANSRCIIFSNFLLNMLPAENFHVTTLIVETWGALLRISTNYDVLDKILEHALNHATEWLFFDTTTDRRFSALLILLEVFEKFPDKGATVIEEVLGSIWNTLLDINARVRELSVILMYYALIYNVVAPARREAVIHSLLEQPFATLASPSFGENTAASHVAVLLVSAVLAFCVDVHPAVRPMNSKQYETVVRAALQVKPNQVASLKLALLSIIPLLAEYNPSEFVSHYLHEAVKATIHICRLCTSCLDKSIALLVLGSISSSVGLEAVYDPHLQDSIIPLLINVLLQKPRVDAAGTCLALLAESCPIDKYDLLTQQIHKLNDAIFSSTVTPELAAGLSRVAQVLPSLLPLMQDKLLEDIYVTLTGKSRQVSTVVGDPSGGTVGNQSFGTLSVSGALTGGETARSEGGRSQSGRNINPMSAADLSRVIASDDAKLACLRVLKTFNMSGQRLGNFFAEAAVDYLWDPNPQLRKEVVTVSVRLLLTDCEADEQRADGRWEHRGRTHIAMLSRVIEHLLSVAISDPQSDIRRDALLCLTPEIDTFLAFSSNIQCLFSALNDEFPSNRYVAMNVLQRVVPLNPSIAMPHLRKMMLRLLSELQNANLANFTRVDTLLMLGKVLQATSNRFCALYADTIMGIMRTILTSPVTNSSPMVRTTSIRIIAQLLQSTLTSSSSSSSGDSGTSGGDTSGKNCNNPFLPSPSALQSTASGISASFALLSTPSSDVLGGGELFRGNYDWLLELLVQQITHYNDEESTLEALQALLYYIRGSQTTGSTLQEKYPALLATLYTMLVPHFGSSSAIMVSSGVTTALNNANTSAGASGSGKILMGSSTMTTTVGGKNITSVRKDIAVTIMRLLGSMLHAEAADVNQAYSKYFLSIADVFDGGRRHKARRDVHTSDEALSSEGLLHKALASTTDVAQGTQQQRNKNDTSSSLAVQLKKNNSSSMNFWQRSDFHHVTVCGMNRCSHELIHIFLQTSLEEELSVENCLHCLDACVTMLSNDEHVHKVVHLYFPQVWKVLKRVFPKLVSGRMLSEGFLVMAAAITGAGPCCEEYAGEILEVCQQYWVIVSATTAVSTAGTTAPGSTVSTGAVPIDPILASHIAHIFFLLLKYARSALSKEVWWILSRLLAVLEKYHRALPYVDPMIQILTVIDALISFPDEAIAIALFINLPKLLPTAVTPMLRAKIASLLTNCLFVANGYLYAGFITTSCIFVLDENGRKIEQHQREEFERLEKQRQEERGVNSGSNRWFFGAARKKASSLKPESSSLTSQQDSVTVSSPPSNIKCLMPEPEFASFFPSSRLHFLGFSERHAKDVPWAVDDMEMFACLCFVAIRCKPADELYQAAKIVIGRRFNGPSSLPAKNSSFPTSPLVSGGASLGSTVTLAQQQHALRFFQTCYHRSSVLSLPSSLPPMQPSHANNPLDLHLPSGSAISHDTRMILSASASPDGKHPSSPGLYSPTSAHSPVSPIRDLFSPMKSGKSNPQTPVVSSPVAAPSGKVGSQEAARSAFALISPHASALENTSCDTALPYGHGCKLSFPNASQEFPTKVRQTSTYSNNTSGSFTDHYATATAAGGETGEQQYTTNIRTSWCQTMPIPTGPDSPTTGGTRPSVNLVEWTKWLEQIGAEVCRQGPNVVLRKRVNLLQSHYTLLKRVFPFAFLFCCSVMDPFDLSAVFYQFVVFRSALMTHSLQKCVPPDVMMVLANTAHLLYQNLDTFSVISPQAVTFLTADIVADIAVGAKCIPQGIYYIEELYLKEKQLLLQNRKTQHKDKKSSSSSIAAACHELNESKFYHYSTRLSHLYRDALIAELCPTVPFLFGMAHPLDFTADEGGREEEEEHQKTDGRFDEEVPRELNNKRDETTTLFSMSGSKRAHFDEQLHPLREKCSSSAFFEGGQKEKCLLQLGNYFLGHNKYYAAFQVFDLVQPITVPSLLGKLSCLNYTCNFEQSLSIYHSLQPQFQEDQRIAEKSSMAALCLSDWDSLQIAAPNEPVVETTMMHYLAYYIHQRDVNMAIKLLEKLRVQLRNHSFLLCTEHPRKKHRFTLILQQLGEMENSVMINLMNNNHRNGNGGFSFSGDANHGATTFLKPTYFFPKHASVLDCFQTIAYRSLVFPKHQIPNSLLSVCDALYTCGNATSALSLLSSVENFDSFFSVAKEEYQMLVNCRNMHRLRQIECRVSSMLLDGNGHHRKQGGTWVLSPLARGKLVLLHTRLKELIYKMEKCKHGGQLQQLQMKRRKSMMTGSVNAMMERERSFRGSTSAENAGTTMRHKESLTVDMFPAELECLSPRDLCFACSDIESHWTTQLESAKYSYTLLTQQQEATGESQTQHSLHSDPLAESIECAEQRINSSVPEMPSNGGGHRTVEMKPPCIDSLHLLGSYSLRLAEYYQFQLTKMKSRSQQGLPSTTTEHPMDEEATADAKLQSEYEGKIYQLALEAATAMAKCLHGLEDGCVADSPWYERNATTTSSFSTHAPRLSFVAVQSLMLRYWSACKLLPVSALNAFSTPPPPPSWWVEILSYLLCQFGNSETEKGHHSVQQSSPSSPAATTAADYLFQWIVPQMAQANTQLFADIVTLLLSRKPTHQIALLLERIASTEGGNNVLHAETTSSEEISMMKRKHLSSSSSKNTASDSSSSSVPKRRHIYLHDRTGTIQIDLSASSSTEGPKQTTTSSLSKQHLSLLRQINAIHEMLQFIRSGSRLKKRWALSHYPDDVSVNLPLVMMHLHHGRFAYAMERGDGETSHKLDSFTTLICAGHSIVEVNKSLSLCARERWQLAQQAGLGPGRLGTPVLGRSPNMSRNSSIGDLWNVAHSISSPSANPTKKISVMASQEAVVSFTLANGSCVNMKLQQNVDALRWYLASDFVHTVATATMTPAAFEPVRWNMLSAPTEEKITAHFRPPMILPISSDIALVEETNLNSESDSFFKQFPTLEQIGESFFPNNIAALDKTGQEYQYLDTVAERVEYLKDFHAAEGVDGMIPKLMKSQAIHSRHWFESQCRFTDQMARWSILTYFLSFRNRSADNIIVDTESGVVLHHSLVSILVSPFISQLAVPAHIPAPDSPINAPSVSWCATTTATTSGVTQQLASRQTTAQTQQNPIVPFPHTINSPPLARHFAVPPAPLQLTDTVKKSEEKDHPVAPIVSILDGGNKSATEGEMGPKSLSVTNYPSLQYLDSTFDRHSPMESMLKPPPSEGLQTQPTPVNFFPQRAPSRQQRERAGVAHLTPVLESNAPHLGGAYDPCPFRLTPALVKGLQIQDPQAAFAVRLSRHFFTIFQNAEFLNDVASRGLEKCQVVHTPFHIEPLLAKLAAPLPLRQCAPLVSKPSRHRDNNSFFSSESRASFNTGSSTPQVHTAPPTEHTVTTPQSAQTGGTTTSAAAQRHWSFHSANSIGTPKSQKDSVGLGGGINIKETDDFFNSVVGDIESTYASKIQKCVRVYLARLHRLSSSGNGDAMRMNTRSPLENSNSSTTAGPDDSVTQFPYPMVEGPLSNHSSPKVIYSLSGQEGSRATNVNTTASGESGATSDRSVSEDNIGTTQNRQNPKNSSSAHHHQHQQFLFLEKFNSTSPRFRSIEHCVRLLIDQAVDLEHVAQHDWSWGPQW